MFLMQTLSPCLVSLTLVPFLFLKAMRAVIVFTKDGTLLCPQKVIFPNVYWNADSHGENKELMNQGVPPEKTVHPRRHSQPAIPSSVSLRSRTPIHKEPLLPRVGKMALPHGLSLKTWSNQLEERLSYSQWCLPQCRAEGTWPGGWRSSPPATLPPCSRDAQDYQVQLSKQKEEHL